MCPVLYFFCASLLYLLIMWLIVSSLSPHNLHLQFCCILSIFALVLMAFCAIVWRDSVSLFWFPFRSHVQIFLYVIYAVYCLKYMCSSFSFLSCFQIFLSFFLFVFMLRLRLLAAVISLSLLFLMCSLSLYIISLLWTLFSWDHITQYKGLELDRNK